MALGYCAYCKAGSFTNAEGSRMHVGMSILDVRLLYDNALKYYHQAVSLYINKHGKAHVYSIRMMCNIGLVYKALATALPDQSVHSHTHTHTHMYLYVYIAML